MLTVNLDDNPIHQLLPAEPENLRRTKPKMVKVAQKVNIMSKSGSEQLFDTEQLSKWEEDIDIGEEFVELDPDSLISTEKPIGSLSSEARNSLQKSNRTSSLTKLEKCDSGDKQDEDTNISGVKVSISSRGNKVKDECTPQPSTHKK